MLTPEKIIEKRKKLWEENKSIDQDREYTEMVAEYITRKENKEIRDIIRERPYLLIEMLFQIPNKNGKTVPFFLNVVQRDFQNKLQKEIKNNPHKQKKIIILKGRQQGFTSYITAYQLAYTITINNLSGKTIAHTREDTTAIFQTKAKFFYENLPEKIQPHKKYDSKSEYFFDKLNSHWTISTAGSKNGGRSGTHQLFHGSEVAFWKDAQSKLAGLGEAIVPTGILMLESTANGYNFFKTIFDDALEGNNNYIAFFYEWWRTPEYRTEIETKNVLNKLKKALKNKRRFKNVPSKIIEKLAIIKDKNDLDYEQIYWWIGKYQDKKNKALQEYPHEPQDAFLTSGDTYFDSEKIKLLLNRIDKNNYIDTRKNTWIWKKPQAQAIYVIGADVAEGKGNDASSAVVYRVDEGFEQVLVYHSNQIPPDRFGIVLADIAREYNEALIAVERNNHGHSVINTLENQEYYYNLFENHKGDYGWLTTGSSKYLMLDEFDTAIREDDIEINDYKLLNELLSVIIDKNGKASVNGKDRVVANAIAWQMRKHVQREKIGTDIMKVVQQGGWL